MEKAKIFISYKRKNKKKVFSIVNKIESQLGVKCWIDLDGIESSEQFRNKICNAIDNSDIVLFMHSSVHLSIDFENDWTIKELNYAHEKKKRVILVKLDDTPLDKDFLMEYGTKNNIDPRDKAQFQNLLRDLKLWLDIPQQTQDNIKFNDKTNTSFFTRLVNKIKECTKKANANAFDEKVVSSFNTKQETQQDHSQGTSSKIHKIYDEDGILLYEGEMKDGKYHGQGTLYFNGGIYVGQFEKGKFHGQGTLYIDGEIQYKGQWVNNASHGKGIEYDLNGGYYEGEFEFGKPNGQGTRYFANGDKYEGEFADGNFHGEGIFYYANGAKYEGEFENSEFNGHGIKYNEDGEIVYEGLFEHDEFNGQGTLYLGDGVIYEGEFENGEFHGHGALHFSDGAIYVGEFKNNKQHGNGTWYEPDGTQEIVTYNMGEVI